MKRVTLSGHMTKQLVTVGWDRPIDEAFWLMEDYHVRHLPVVDDEGYVVGILSDRDVNLAMNPGKPGFQLGAKVSGFMSWPALTVDEQTSLREVALGMADEKVSSFLVTRGGNEVVGIVTTDDLLRFLADSMSERKGFSLRNLPYSPVVEEAMRELGAAGL
ncbi:MAG TPA: CBS domain-containing protein [Bdellovibrionota bacterium]|jgi:acetoin utilization protein AcuB